MKPYPHFYHAAAQGAGAGMVRVSSADLGGLETAPPPEFDGPGGVWSPETLLVAAIADCFILTFRGVARAARFEWEQLHAQVEGTLEKIDGVTQFTRFITRAALTVKPGADRQKATELLQRAEHVCLISNSLRGERRLECTVDSPAA